jgi:CRISPR-associated endonuclease Csn1
MQLNLSTMENEKVILGLDLGTNSIGWALINQNFDNKKGEILGLGSRIIPMSQDILDNFGKGQSHSQTADRTNYRGVRRLFQRENLRRERLHRVLNVLDFLPEHYKKEIDFETHLGQFINHSEPKIAHFIDENKNFHFLFKDSFNEMVEEFKQNHPQLFDNNKSIPYDWTIYYLRKKALTQKLAKEELAWLLLNFNQKRGYYQLRGEDDEVDKSKKEEFFQLKVVDVKETVDKKASGEVWYNVYLENGWIYKRSSKIPIFDWNGKIKEFIVTSDLNEDETVKKDKDGVEKRSFRAVDSEKDWIAIKKKTERDIENSEKTIGTFIYDSLLENPTQKINGKLVKTVERKYYKDELTQILKTQIQLNSELFNNEKYEKCIFELYPNNEAHRNNIKQRDFLYLFLDDIIFYQRPLKSKVSLISDCSLENRVKIVDGITEKVPVKCIAKSSPIFQEFRLWQFIKNLKIYALEKEVNGKLINDVEVTSDFIFDEKKHVELFDFLNDKEEITQKQFLAFYKLKEDKFRWNYVENKSYPCNETRAKFLKRIAKIESIDKSFFTTEITQHLWHILYSVTDKEEIKSAIEKFALKHKLNQEFIDSFSKFPPYKKEYGSFSEKAIKKLLPLMRVGKYWDENLITDEQKTRAAYIVERLKAVNYDLKKIEEVSDDDFPKQVLKSFLNCKDLTKGLNTYQASYLVYNRHSESSDTKKWNTAQDIADFLNPRIKGSFKQHSLRNPIVEQVISETLRVVKDIWQEYGNGEVGFFDEIHIELGRDMKNPADKRKQMTAKISENENTNIRVKAILTELMNDGIDVRPYSPSQQEILKIYEEGVYENEFRKDKLEEIQKIRKTSSPTKSDIVKYKLWLEQGYISPYTGKMIPLSELFSTKYQIEHIIPQSRFFDDSMNNKVICESEVNELKDNKTAFEFISKNPGRLVSLNYGESVKLFTIDQYEQHIKSYFSKNRSKKANLLSEDIPDSFINRQLNDSRYISKVVKNLLSKIVKDENETDVTSKNIVTLSGSITSKMKQDWGLNNVWNEIVTPRFERMNQLTNSENYGKWENKQGKNVFQTAVPDELVKGFNKKRIDHRHHALDALVIACVTKDHVNYITSLNTERKNHSLVAKLKEVVEIEKKSLDANGDVVITKQKVTKEFHKPWKNFTQDAKEKLFSTVISFKQNVRVITKTNNKSLKWVDENGELKKKLVPQTKGQNLAIRKPLHKETVSGQIKLDRIKVPKGKILTATRKSIDESFNLKTIESITDTGIQKILLNYLKFKGNLPDLAFSSEGLEEMNMNIEKYNGGKKHQPIYKARIFEMGSKFPVGENGNKKGKFVEAAKGTNLFFAVYWNEAKQKREFETIPLNVVIENLKSGNSPANSINENGNQLMFTLSPNDLVYVPTFEEQNNKNLVDFDNLNKNQADRIYKMVSSTGSECHFILNKVSSLIKNYDAKSKIGEFGSINKLETTIDLIDSVRVKEVCWKLKVNRLGKIVHVGEY